jgi:hypothetical protein
MPIYKNWFFGVLCASSWMVCVGRLLRNSFCWPVPFARMSSACMLHRGDVSWLIYLHGTVQGWQGLHVTTLFGVPPNVKTPKEKIWGREPGRWRDMGCTGDYRWNTSAQMNCSICHHWWHSSSSFLAVTLTGNINSLVDNLKKTTYTFILSWNIWNDQKLICRLMIALFNWILVKITIVWCWMAFKILTEREAIVPFVQW